MGSCVCELPYFVYALAQKPMKVSKRKFLLGYFILRLRADFEIQIRGGESF